jgi:alkanesulfonate monooxygenase SsuD/methylene tetrahydromethanopterin reductase-like flavin-dependent oxidoreductase (luciferase family)
VRVVVQHAVGDPAWHPSVLAPPAVGDFARLAEKHGYAGIAFTDHPAPTVRWTAAGGEGSADPLVSLAYCAAVTSSIELMTFVLALPYHNPFRLAHQAATLDALSGGRLTLGLGTGYLRGEMRAMGADPSARLASFDAVLETMLTAWTAESVSGSFPALESGAVQGPVSASDTMTSSGSVDGTLSRSVGGSSAGTVSGWSAREVHVQPRPVQQPHPPLWFHGNAAFGRARAARYGGGWLGVLTTPQLAATMRTAHLPDLKAAHLAIEDLHRRAGQAGRDPGQIAIGLGGLWPILDIRKGWDSGAIAEAARAAAAIGVGTVFTTICGDDPSAANDTLAAFGEQMVGAVRDIGIRRGAA